MNLFTFNMFLAMKLKVFFFLKSDDLLTQHAVFLETDTVGEERGRLTWQVDWRHWDTGWLGV